MDKLKQMFEMQKSLNNYVFQKQGIKDVNGRPLMMQTIINEARKDTHIGANTDVCKWLGNYLTAMDDESKELRAEIPWKWWSKEFLDMQNIRVEVVDKLHFWMSIAMSAGMNADDVFRIYEQKNLVNLQRQDKGYNATDKTEDDNKGIK